MPETAYVVLIGNVEDESLSILASTSAVSADAAVRNVAAADGTYFAIPERSFKPVKVKVETKRVVTLA